MLTIERIDKIIGTFYPHIDNSIEYTIADVLHYRNWYIFEIRHERGTIINVRLNRDKNTNGKYELISNGGWDNDPMRFGSNVELELGTIKSISVFKEALYTLI